MIILKSKLEGLKENQIDLERINVIFDNHLWLKGLTCHILNVPKPLVGKKLNTTQHNDSKQLIKQLERNQVDIA